MRATAKIEPVALVIDLQVLTFGDRINQLDLVILALGGEDFLGLFARPDFAGKRLVALNDFLHALFDLRQIFGREGLVLGEVVIEAVLDDRADRHLRAGPKLLHGLGHDVGGIVADEFQRTLVFTRDDLDLAIGDGIGQIAHGAVKRNGDGLLGKRFGNGFGNLAAGRAGGVAADGSIGKCKGNGFRHRLVLLSSPANECGWCWNNDLPAENGQAA
ncbi:hypothetical protein D3C80_139400 [compost metagenome]